MLPFRKMIKTKLESLIFLYFIRVKWHFYGGIYTIMEREEN